MTHTTDSGIVREPLLAADDSHSGAFSPVWPVSSYQTTHYNDQLKGGYAPSSSAEASYADWQLNSAASQSLLLTFSPPNVPLFAVASAERVRSMDEHQSHSNDADYDQLNALHEWRQKLYTNVKFHFISLMLLCFSRWWWTSLLVALLVIAVIAYLRHNDILLTSQQLVKSAVGILLLNVSKDVLILFTVAATPPQATTPIGFFSSMILLSVVIDTLVVTPLSLYYCHRLYGVTTFFA